MYITNVSIIIPTYNDWERLRLCIEALSQQSYPNSLFEVIIVNNNVTDTLPPNFLLPSNFSLFIESKEGSYAARNTGLKIAKGDLIGFIDSDCIPDKRWIENAVIFFNNNKGCARIAGNIKIFFDELNSTIADKYEKLYAFPQKIYVKNFKAGVTGNLFVVRKVFENVGFFDDKLMSSGDLEWGKRAHLAGFPINYVENVVVNHPSRNLAQLIRKEKRIGGGLGVKRKLKKEKISTFFQVINGLRPRISEFKFVYQNSFEYNHVDKLKVIFLRHFLLTIRMIECLKVQLGKKPARS